MTPLPTVERVTEEVERLRTEAARAIQDCVRDAERSIRRTQERLADARDEAVHHVRRQPVQSMAIAFGVGAVVGLVLAAAGRSRKA